MVKKQSSVFRMTHTHAPLTVPSNVCRYLSTDSSLHSSALTKGAVKMNVFSFSLSVSFSFQLKSHSFGGNVMCKMTDSNTHLYENDKSGSSKCSGASAVFMEKEKAVEQKAETDGGKD